MNLFRVLRAWLRHARGGPKPDRFEAARGKAQIKRRTDEWMALLRDSGSER